MGKKKKGLRQNKGKLRLDLIPPEFDEILAQILAQGAEKYEDRNWELGLSYMDCVASLRRHLLSWQQGNDVDDESGLHLMGHVAINALFIYAFEMRGMADDFDDRPIAPGISPR